MSNHTVAAVDPKLIATLTELKQAHPEWGCCSLARAARCTEYRAQKFLDEGGSSDAVAAVPSQLIKPEEFLYRLDYGAQLRRAVSKLKRGYLPEYAFRASLNMPADKFRRAADMPEFEPYKIKIDGKIHWAPKDLVTEAARSSARWR